MSIPPIDPSNVPATSSGASTGGSAANSAYNASATTMGNYLEAQYPALQEQISVTMDEYISNTPMTKSQYQAFGSALQQVFSSSTLSPNVVAGANGYITQQISKTNSDISTATYKIDMAKLDYNEEVEEVNLGFSQEQNAQQEEKENDQQ